MSQGEILGWLKDKRLSGDHSFFTNSMLREECPFVPDSRYGLWCQVNKLTVYEFVEVDPEYKKLLARWGRYPKGVRYKFKTDK